MMGSEQCIEKIYDEERQLIQQAEREKRLVFFVGAGASIASGMPLWSKVVAEIKKQLPAEGDQEDFLKIAQYYYRKCRENEYTRFMRQLFQYGKNLSPNPIHHELMKFQVSTIVTTNYDDLLEETFRQAYRVVDVIRRDKDLAYGCAENKIIKMHGDFVYDNFVLKEEDYLNYSRNFRLIQAYIKALIAGNTVLFIGYSFRDPDLKHIFSWLRDILGRDMPRSYMILTNSAYSELEAGYFDDFGIKLLYADQKYPRLPHEDQLVKMLQFLREKKEQTMVRKIYDALRPLWHLKYVHRQYIERAFSSAGICLDNNRFIVIENIGFAILDRIRAFGSATDIPHEECVPDDDKECYEDIYKILAKSGVYWYVRDEKMHKHKIFQPHSDEAISMEHILSAIVEYDIPKLKKLRHKNKMLLGKDPVLYVEQAALSYHLEEYVEAYQYLQKATDACYRQGKYVWYFISLLNRKYLAKIIYMRPRLRYSEEESEKIREDAEGIDLNKVFYSLPDMGNEHNTFLRELYTFQIFYSTLLDTHKKAEKAQKEAQTSYTLFTNTPAIIELRQYITENWFYVIKNGILLDQYIEFSSCVRQYASSLLTTMTAMHIERKEDTPFDTTVGNVQPEQIDAMDIYFILRYLPLEDIKFILSRNEGSPIIINDDAVQRLEHILLNMRHVDKLEADELFEKILRLLYHSELSCPLIQVVLQTLVNPVGNIRFPGQKIAITNFFAQASRCENLMTEEINSAELLHEFIEQLLAAVIHRYIDQYEVEHLLVNALYLYKKMKNGGDFKSQYMSALLSEEYLYTLSSLYSYVDDNRKKEITNLAECVKWDFSGIIQNTMQNSIDLANTVRENHTLVPLILFCKLLGTKILSPDKSQEEKRLAILQDVPDDRKLVYPSSYERIVECIGNAYLAQAFIETERVRTFIQQSGIPFYSWAVDPENYDYNKFECAWLMDCSPELLRRMGDNKKTRENIQNAIREQYMTSEKKKDILKIYFQYFVG